MNTNKTTESVYARPPRPMTYGRLNTWAEMPDPGQLVLFMSAERKQLEQFLQSDQISPKMFSLLLKAVDHALTAHHQNFAVQNLLEIISQTKFFNQHLVHYFYNISMSDMWDTGHEEMKASSRIVRTLVEILPSKLSTGFACVTQLANILNTAQEFNGKNKLLEDLKSISDLAKKIHNSKKQNAITQSGKQLLQDDNVKPPDDFRNVKVVPALSDFKENGAIFIRPSKSKGVYDDVSQYLDIQFRLMREDFLIPLRQGISELRKHGTNRHWKTGDLNLRLYRNVRIDGWELDRHILIHWISFDTAQTIRVNWKGSKRLINGSVVCLSRDNFKTMIFAIVDLRDKNDRENGLVSVVVESGYDVIYKSHPGDEYIMAESTTLFEPYRHVLVGLQASHTDLPLTDYILKCRSVLKPPRYLLNYYKSRTVPKYNLSCLMKNYEDWECPVLTTTKWPPCESMCLNKSQREAAILALTKEMVLIQGPPGTGKTYVGLKVMEAIMKNLDVVFGTGPAAPILIVCYTNHALDQFLEGILKFCDDGIVRVGGGSKSTKLRSFNLTELKHNARVQKSFNFQSINTLKLFHQVDLDRYAYKMKKCITNLENLNFRIFHEDVMSKYMDEQHYLSLNKDCQFTDNKESKLSQWLHAPHSTTEDNPQTILEDLLTKLVLKWDLVLPDMTVTLPCDIIQRASLYCTVASRYKEDLNGRIENCSDQSEIKLLEEKVNALSSQLLMDDEIEHYLPNKILDAIEFEIRNSCTVAYEGHFVKCWILGLNKSVDNQKNDVKALQKGLQFRHSGQFEDNIAGCIQEFQAQMLSYSALDKDVKNDYESGLKSIVEVEGLYDSVCCVLGEEIRDRLKSIQVFKLLSEPAMPEQQAQEIKDVSKLQLSERYALYNMWCQKYRNKLLDKRDIYLKRSCEIKSIIKQIEEEETLFHLKRAKVIGMTTTGAAKHRDVLQSVGSKIVVVEEAAEVFESHIITALNPQCNHLILIGDHQQLRPKPNVYELARHYGLEVSLFERLIKNNVPHVVLKVQHRMRPEISKLMRHIYPELEDDDSVFKYKNVRGIENNVYFINHNVAESCLDDSLSKENIHEASFIVALCQYVLNQGYTPRSVTILTTYAGQVLAIQKLAQNKRLTEKVRIAAVDDFQGEENDTILLSLVRSNEDENVGFLKVDNRICVALSRAKKGLYVIGNFDLLASQSKLWSKIVKEAKKEKMFGEGLPIFCRNHPENKIVVKTAEDFRKRPEGGCGIKCEMKLSCGHSCEMFCHGYDRYHIQYLCTQPCRKVICSMGHPCTRRCNIECGQCQFPVLKSLPCGHDVEIPCSKKQTEETFCQIQCSTVLECSHQCPGKCGDCLKSKQHKQCKVLVSHTFACGDVAEMPCYKTKSDPACQRVCGTILDCKHSCTGTCSTCTTDKHVVCSVQVSHTWPCGHVGDVPCHVSRSDPPCKKYCEFVLRCGHKCSGSCLSCTTSGHKPCNEICQTILTCGHVCGGLCWWYVDGSHHACIRVCGEIFSCGHKCLGECRKCASLGQCKCTDVCNKTLTCGHQCQGICGVCSQSSHPTCLQECQKKLPCGHKCRGKCGECKQHTQCQDKCNKTLLCGHTCLGQCGQSCPPCQQPCPNSCRHRSCRTNKNKPLCGELCQPCMKKLVIECPHQKMTKLCQEMWQTPPCEMKCTKTLKMFLLKNGKPYFCRHPCSGLCNEICVCSICERIFPIYKNLLIPNINERTESERLVLKIPSCSHIFYVDELDKYMKTFDQNGTEYIGCPECSHPIMNCLRYENILKERRVRRETMKQLSGAIGGSHLVEEIKEIKQSPDLRADEQTNSINNDSQNSMIVQLTSASEQRFSDNFGDSDATILKAQGETLRKIIRFQNRKDVRTVNPRQFRSQSSMENTTRENSASLNWRRRGPESSGQEGSWRMSSSS